MARPQPTYGARLEAARAVQGISKRQLGIELAARLDRPGADVARSLKRYFKDEETPSPERAAVLAVILDAPELALPPTPAERRRDRLAELEAEVMALTDGLDALRATVELLEQRQAREEKDAPPARRARGKPSARRTGSG